jgi:hypothetical protein
MKGTEAMIKIIYLGVKRSKREETQAVAAMCATHALVLTLSDEKFRD